ncbi:hypothetical protein AQJ23_39765 [Streptomyces antibioticus]|nr:hypothetical protein [Streptomyces antibioticus]KUN18369.1 hypothetical protein AQJ23_39765 [Streptomyces antibioticus]
MARPQDWSALGMHGDPTPGDPDALSSLYQGLRDTEHLGEEITSGLNRVLDQSGNGFLGKTAEAVREKIDGHLKQFIDAIGKSFSIAADATMAYRNALLDVQAKADQALSGAQGLSKDDPQLAAHKAQAHTAQDDYHHAVRLFQQRMRDAEHEIRQPIDAWHLFLKSLGILEIILAIVGAIFGGWIGLLAFGLGMVMFISTLVDFAEGKAGVLDVVLAFVGILFPSTKGLNIGALAKGVFNALKNLPKTLSAGVSNIGGGLAHILTTGISIRGIYGGVTALPGLVLRGLNGLANLAMKGVRITIAGLKLLAHTFRTDFQVATAGISTTLGKVAVYPISFGGRLLLGAVLPVDFFELGVGFNSAFKMGFGTRLLTPTAHLSQNALGGSLHIGALTGGHGGLTGLPSGISFNGFGHGALQSLNPGGLHGLNTGIDTQFGGLHGISLGADIGGVNGGLTSLHSLNGTGNPGAVGNLMANAGGLDSIDHLTAFDHATGFQRTSAGLLEPLPTHFGGTSVAGGHNLSDLGSTGLHALRGDLTPSGTGLHTSFSDALSSVRVATGHVEDFHALGIPELRSIVDGDISGIRMTHEGISMQVGAQSGTPTTLHVDYRGTAVTNGEGKQVVVAPEVHEAIGTTDIMAGHGAAHGLQTPPPTVTTGHMTTDAKAGATPTTSVATDVKAGELDMSAGAVEVKAGTLGTTPPATDAKVGSIGASSGGGDLKAGALGGPSAGGVKGGSADGPSVGGVKGGGTAAPSAGGAKTGVRGLDGLSGGTPERLAEEPASPSITAQSDQLGVSARADLDLLGQRVGTGDAAGVAASTHVKAGSGTSPTGAVRVLDDGSGAVVVGEHIALRPARTPVPKQGATAGGGRPAPLSKFEAVTGGATGKTGQERLVAWNEYELASAAVADAKRQLDETGGKIGQPSENVDQAAAKLDLQHAEGASDIAQGKLVRLGMDVESIEAHLDALGIPGPRPSRMADVPSGHGTGTAGEAAENGAGLGAKTGVGAAPIVPGKSLPFSPGEIERFWGLDGERVDALFGGPHDPLSGDRRQLWREFTQARYDVGRLEGQVRVDQPRAGGSSGPSAHELKLRQELSAAQSNLDDLRRQLDDLGVDSAHMDRQLWDLHSQSLKERPRLDGAGVQHTASSSHTAAELPKLDGLMTQQQAAVKAMPKAESAAAQAQTSYDAKLAKLKLQQDKFDQLPEGTNERGVQKAKKDLDKAQTDVDKAKPGLDAALAELKKAQDALRKAQDDLAAGVDLHVAARDFAQRDVQRYVEKFAAEGHLDLAGVLRTHADDLSGLTRADLAAGRPVRWDQIALTGQEVKEHAEQVLTQAKDLEQLLGPVTKSGHTDFVEVKVTTQLKDAAQGLGKAADNLGSMLEKGFIKDAAPVGGVYGLRAEHGPLSFTAGKLAQRVSHALENATPGDVVRIDGVFSTEKALADFHELGQVVRRFRSDKAYEDVPKGTQWETVLPGHDADWKKAYGSLDKLTPEQQQKFVRDLSKKNLTTLDAEVEKLIKQHPDRAQDLRGLLDRLRGLDYRVKHATPAYHAIANSGLMSSQGDLARRDVKFLASGKSSVKNTSSLGNDDFVFFRMDVGDAPMATRYGPTTLVFDAKVLKEHGGWVSLHDQLHPLDRPAMQKLEVAQKTASGEALTSKVFRSAQYDSGFEKIGAHAKWTYKYPQNGDLTRTVTFETEVFHGEDVTHALALSVVREVISMGSEYTDLALKMSTEDLGRLVSKLFRPEAKFGSGLPITPKAVDGLAQGERNLLGVGPEPLHVHDPDGDGRYFPDGTMDPVGRWSGKHADAAQDAFRSAEHGVQENNTVKIDAHLKEAKASIEESIELTKGWKLDSPERLELIERLLKKREALLGDIEHLQGNWKTEVQQLHGAKNGTGQTAKPKGTSPKDGAAKAPKDGGVKAPKDGGAKTSKSVPASGGPKASGKPKPPARDTGVVADTQMPDLKASGAGVMEPKGVAAEISAPAASGPPRPSEAKVPETPPATSSAPKASEPPAPAPTEALAPKAPEPAMVQVDIAAGQGAERAVMAAAHNTPQTPTAPAPHTSSDSPTVSAADSSAAPTASAAHTLPDTPTASEVGSKDGGADAGPGRAGQSASVKGVRRPDMLDPDVFRQQTATLTGVRAWSDIRFLDDLLHEYQAVPEPDVVRRVTVLRELEAKAQRYLAGEPDPQRVPGVELLVVQVGFELKSLSHVVRDLELPSVERLTASDVARLWQEDATRIDALFGGPRHPLHDQRVEAWGKLTQARYDVGRIEGQLHGDQPHAGRSSGPSAHEVKLRQDLSAAQTQLDAAKQDLVRLGLAPGQVDRGLAAHYAQSLKDRPRAVAGGHQPAAAHSAGEPHALDDLLAEHTKAVGQVPSAKVRLEDATVARDGALTKWQRAKEKFEGLKSEYDRLPEPTKQQTRQYQKAQKEAEAEEKYFQAQQSKFEARKAELDAAAAKAAQAWRVLDGAVDDVLGAGTHAQQELSRLVDTFAGAADVEHAVRVQQHARALDISARAGLDGPHPRLDQVLWTGKDIEDQAKQVGLQAEQLEKELSGEPTGSGKATPADVQAHVDRLRASVGKLHGMLDGFVTDAASHGGVYALRNTHGPLALAAGHLVGRADDAVKKAGPDAAIRLTEPFDTHKAAEGLRTGATRWLRGFRTGKAYADVPTGTQWRAVLPGSEGQWNAVFDDLDKLMSRQPTPAHELSQAELKSLREGIAQQETFVEKLSQRNIENLRQEIDTLIATMPPERQEAFQALKQRLLDLPYRVKHATPAYHAIANSGVLSSQGDLARRNVKHLVSGKSSANNTSNLGNDDFVFFRMEVGDGAMASRYGPTTLVFDAKVLEEHGGWVSLHDQLHPLDRRTMQELLLDEQMTPVTEPASGTKVFRTGQYDTGFKDIGKRAQWTHAYPQNAGATRTVTFEQEVFHGRHVVEALALSVIREVDSIGGAFPAHVLGLDAEGLGKVVSQLFRPEAKFGSGLPITPMNAFADHGMPQPLRVINEHGDGRYLPDGTMDPVARAAGKQHDLASDALRQADNSKTSGHDGKAKDHLKDAKAHAQRSVDLTKTFQEGATGERRELATKLYDERKALLDHIDAKLTKAQSPDQGPSAKPSGTKGAAHKGATPKAAASKASGSKAPAVQSAGATPPDAEGTRLHTALSPLFGDRTTPDLVSVARGLAEHGDLTAPTEPGKTFGLSKRAYDKVSKDLESKGLVQRVNGGLLLTEQGGHLLLPQGARPEAPPHVTVASDTHAPTAALPHPTPEPLPAATSQPLPAAHTQPPATHGTEPPAAVTPESVPVTSESAPVRGTEPVAVAAGPDLAPKAETTAPEPPASPQPLPQAPSRMTVSGQIGGADRMLPSREAAATVTRNLVEHFDDALTPAQRDALRSDLQAQLGREVWPSLPAMTRGESRTLTVDVAGFSGDIKVRAEVTKAEPDGAFKSLEFEDGSESLVRDGFQRETRSVVTAGVLVKGKAAPQTDLTGHLTSNWSRTESHRMTSSGRLFSRTKTSEPALRLDVEVRLEFDVSGVSGPSGKHLARPGASAGRIEVSAKVPVAVAEADVRPSAGMQHYLPPARVEQTLALGGTDTVRDLFLVDAEGVRVSGSLHQALLGSGADPHSLEAYGKRVFGDRWPAVRELVLDRLGSLDSLQYRLKGMTAGEALEIDLGPDAGSLLVTAEVTTMKHLRNTEKTEFNTGSDVTRVYTRTHSSEHGVRATMQAQSADLHAGPTTVTGVGHGEFDRDGALTAQESVRTGTAVKMKVPGAVFDGMATLSFVHRAHPLGASPAPAHAAPATSAPHPTAANPPGGRARIGFQVLVDAADARPVAEPEVFSAADRPQGPRRMTAPALQEGDHAWRPSAGVWDGLPSHTVVLDVLSGEERALGAAQSPRLTDLVDGAGREHFGADWADVRPAAHDMASREQLAATLPQLTRGTTARSTPLPTPLRSNAQLSLSGRLESLEYVRTLDAAEINLLSDVADETGGRLGASFGHGQLAQGGVQPELGSDFTLAVHAPGGGVAHRYRTAGGVSGGHSSVAGAKYPEPMAVYIATVRVDAHVGRVGESATHGGRTDVRCVVALPKSHTQRYEVTAESAGSQVFHRPDSVTPPSPAAAAAASAVRPPLRVSDSGQIGNGDAVLELPGDSVVKELRRQLADTFGERWGQVEGEVAQYFDSIALQPRTAGLTAGDTWGGSFRAGPVTADIRITAADAKMTGYLRVEKDFEFEQGTESAAAASVQKDSHVRRTLWERAGFKAPHVTFTLGHVRHKEAVTGHGGDVRGGVVAKNKTVEPAAVFQGEVTYTVQVKTSHALPGLGGERRFTVTSEGQFAFPVRDLPTDPTTGAAHRPEQYRRVPDRISDSQRLGAEDVVLDTRPVRGDAGAPRLVEDVLRQLDPNGPKLFGSAADWKAARAKLAERLPASEFHRRLKSMMAGQPWVVRVNGREVAVRASVKEMTHIADTRATEFNSATVDGTGGGRTESGVTGPQITSDGTNVTVVGTSDPIGGSPAEVFGGGTLAHSTQSEHLTDSASGIRTAAGTKTKMPGSVYDGVARLHFEVRDRWRPFGRGVDTRVPKDALDEQLRFTALREQVDELQRQFDDASAAGRPRSEIDALKQRLDGVEASFGRALTEHTTRVRDAVDARRIGQGTLGFAPMTKRTFGVRVRGVGEAEIGFQAVLPTADTVKAAGADQARFTAPEPGAGRPRPPRRPDEASARIEVPRPPEPLLTHGMSDGQLVRDLPDVQSLRGLLDSEGGKVFGSAWSEVTRTGQRRSELVMGGFTKDRLMSALPELTRGGELRGESFRVHGREAWVSVRADLLGLTHTRSEPRAEVALATEKSYVFGRRGLHSRQFFLLGQAGAVAGTLESKLGAAVTFGGGFRRRTRGDQFTGGRTFTNAKIPTPLQHYDGHVEFTFTFHHGGTRTEASGVVPVGVSVPSAQITERVVVDQDHVFTRPTEQTAARPLDKGKQPAEFTVDEHEAIDAGAALSDARRLRADAERALSELRERQDTGVGGVADGDGTRRAQAQAQLERAEAAETLAESHWSEVTGGRPMPYAVSREGAAVPGLGGGAPHWSRSPRGGAPSGSEAPEGSVVSVAHMPSAGHVVFDTDDGEAYALVPSGPDLTVAHWVSDPASAHGRPADAASGQEAYAGDIVVQRRLLDRALAAAEETPQLKKVLERQATSFEEDVRLFRVLEERTSLRELAPAQLVAVVLAERRALRTLSADWDRLTDNLLRARGSWRWARSYPLDEENLGPVVQRVHRHLLADLSLTVNIDLGARVGDGTLLDAMTGDERLLRNVWEVVPGYSRYFERRGAAEEAMGYPASVKRTTHAAGIYPPRPGLDAWDESFAPTPADRADLPNYAALTSQHRPRGLGLYGNAVFHLKHELLERATFTPGDSFSPGRQGARSITGSGNLLPLLNHGPERLVRLAFAEATGFRYDGEFRLLRDTGELERHLVGFFEVQLHGGVRWEDVERIVLVREGGTPAQQQKARLEQFARETGLGFTVETLEPGAVRPTALAPETPAGDGTLVSAHIGVNALDEMFTVHTSVAEPTPSRDKVATGTHVMSEEEAVPVRASETAGTANLGPAEAFEAVRQQYPDALVHTGRWTMWGHDGDTPHTSAYAIENDALGLRGVFVPPAADRGVGAWHWQLPDHSQPVAVTPLRLPTSAAAHSAPSAPAPIAAGAATHLVPAIEAVPWSAGLHWRADDEELYVFHGAGAEQPAAVFADGLRPAGDHLVHVAVHVADGGAPDSAWLTATRKIGWLRDRAAAAGDGTATELLARYGWRYDVAAPGGVDVNATLDLAAAHPERAEVLYPGGVDGRHIRGAQRLDAGRAVGPYVTNPGFVEPGRPVPAEGTGR